jgi:hypothetical protein
VLDVVTGSVTLLTEAERGSMLGLIGFSPEGDRILFSRTEERRTGGTWVFALSQGLGNSAMVTSRFFRTFAGTIIATDR